MPDRGTIFDQGVGNGDIQHVVKTDAAAVTAAIIPHRPAGPAILDDAIVNHDFGELYKVATGGHAPIVDIDAAAVIFRGAAVNGYAVEVDAGVAHRWVRIAGVKGCGIEQGRGIRENRAAIATTRCNAIGE
ncbi:hypothetical protein ES703_91770 [subsurface metagenome]